MKEMVNKFDFSRAIKFQLNVLRQEVMGSCSRESTYWHLKRESKRPNITYCTGHVTSSGFAVRRKLMDQQRDIT